jgi:hypothetical protein
VLGREGPRVEIEPQRRLVAVQIARDHPLPVVGLGAAGSGTGGASEGVGGGVVAGVSVPIGPEQSRS